MALFDARQGIRRRASECRWLYQGVCVSCNPEILVPS